MESQDERRQFLKGLLSVSGILAGSALSYKKKDLFRLGKMSEAGAKPATSTGKRMKKIAIEEHYYSEEYLKFLRTQEWYKNLGKAGADLETVSNLGEGRIQDMDTGGIDMQVLSLSYPYVEFFEPSDGIAIAKVVNDELRQAVKRYPERFAGFAALATQASPDAAAEELERAVKKLGLVGAMVTGGVTGRYFDDQKYWVIFEAAEKLNVPIYLHGKGPSPYPSGDSEGVARGWDCDTLDHIVRLISSGVFEKYPGLKIIIGHGGESMPFWLYRYRHGELMQSFKNHFYVTTSGQFWDTLLKFLIDVMGPDRVLFAVDYPYESNEEASRFIDSAPISDVDREKICHLNAEKILRV